MRTTRELQKRIHALNHKWWHDADGKPLERNKGELLCLVHSEISEATLGIVRNLMDDHLPHRRMAEVEMADTSIRIHDYAEGFGYDLQGAIEDLQAAAQPVLFSFGHIGQHALIHLQVSAAMEGERKAAIDGDIRHRAAAEVCLARALLLIERYCATNGYDLNAAIEEKLAYNAKRADHTHEARARAGGKKW